jgi:hypothetical protein
MEKRLLLRTHKNRILEEITKRKLNPLDFNFLEKDSILGSRCKVSKLVHKPTGYYFTFDFSRHKPSEHYITYFPTNEGKMKIASESTIDYVFHEVNDWLNVVVREVNAPDLWATISEEKKLFEVVSGIGLGNELFTPEQQKYISEQLRLIKQQLIVTQDLIGGDREFVAAKFDYMEDTLKRLGRYDWIHDVIGAAVTIIWGIALAPGPAKELFSSLGKVISQVLGVGNYLP